MTTVVGFNPYGLKLKHMRLMEKHFGVKFGALVRRMEQLKDFDMSALDASELCAMVYMIRVMQDEDFKPEDVDDLSFEELGTLAATASTAVEVPDPTEGS